MTLSPTPAPVLAPESPLDQEIAHYETLRPELEAEHKGSWAVIHQQELVGIYPDYEQADEAAYRCAGREPCLVRQIGVVKTFKPPFRIRIQDAAAL